MVSFIEEATAVTDYLLILGEEAVLACAEQLYDGSLESKNLFFCRAGHNTHFPVQVGLKLCRKYENSFFDNRNAIRLVKDSLKSELMFKTLASSTKAHHCGHLHQDTMKARMLLIYSVKHIRRRQVYFNYMYLAAFTNKIAIVFMS